MKKWKYDEKSLRKIYEQGDLKISFEEFKKWAEHYANSLINKVKKEIEDEKITSE